MALEDLVPDANLDEMHINDLLASIAGEAERVRITLSRQTKGTSFPFVAEINAQTTEADVKKAFGGGRYRVEIRARQPFGKYKAGSIIGQKTFEAEGDPIKRIASSIDEALQEAESNPRGVTTPPLGGALAQADGTPIGGSLDMGTMFVGMMQMMTTSMQASIDRSAEEARTGRDMLMAVLTRDAERADPFKQIAEIRKLAGLFGDGDESSSVAAEFIKGLPVMEPILMRAMDRLAARPKVEVVEREPEKPEGQKKVEASDSGRTAADADPKDRLSLGLQMIRQAVKDDEYNPHAVASVLASLVGDEIGAALAASDDAPKQFLAQFPDLADYEQRLVEVHGAIRAMYASESTASDPDEAGVVQPEDDSGLGGRPGSTGEPDDRGDAGAGDRRSA